MTRFCYIKEKMMNGRFCLGTAALCLVLALLTPSCSKHHGPEAEVPQLQVTIYIPQPLATKADEGSLRGTEAEREINELIVWLYKTDDAETAAPFYCIHMNASDLAVYNLDAGQEARFMIPLDSEELKQIAEDKPHIDIFAVANPESAGMTLPFQSNTAWNTVSRKQLLDGAIMSGTALFSSENLTVDVPSAGLPFSGCATDCSIGGTFPVLTIDKVTLNRCVSKFRLLLSCMSVEDTDFELTSIVLGTGSDQFSASEYVFNNSANAWKISGYESNTITLLDTPVAGTALAANNTPSAYFFRATGNASETPDQYWARLDAGVSSGKLTEQSHFYLRESDRQLTGTVTYKVNGVEHTKTFGMEAAGDFARNHVWVVYAYFVGGKLVLIPAVLPWTAGNDRFTYTTQGSTDVIPDPWLRYTPSMTYNDWDESWVAISYRFEDDGVTPMYSSKMTFVTNNTYPLLLQLDNDLFRMVISDDENPTPAVWPQLSYTLSAGAHSINVWVIPVDDRTMTEEQSKVGLTLVCQSSSPYMIPISNNFPGDAAHSTIRFRRVSPADYELNKNNTYTTDGVTAYWKEPIG